MNRTKIEWCDYTWNPIFGCSHFSEGCDHCYAERLSRRWRWPWGRAYFFPERLGEPAKLRKPSRIFCGSMTDLAHPTIKSEWRDQIADAMKAAPQHTFIILTKRPALWLRQLPPTCWVGVTIEKQEHIDRWVVLWACSWPAAVKFVSVEPMLGPVTFAHKELRPEWVIAGPETGPGARPCDPKWIEQLSAESPCFFDKRKTGWTRRDFPNPQPDSKP